MAILTVGGTSVSVADASVDRDDEPVGQVRRAYSGAPRSSVQGYFPKWTVKTTPITRSAANTLRGLLEAAPPLTLTGDITGSISGYASDITTRSVTLAGGAEGVVVSFKLWAA